MQVRMLQPISGTRNDQPWPAPGEVIDLPDDEASDLVRSGVAERAAKPRGRRKDGVA
jgi:hypothetical protein